MTAHHCLSALPLAIVLVSGCGPGAPAAPPRAYVSNEADGTVSVIDTRAGAVVATIPVGKRPRGLRISSDHRTLYVALSGSPRSPPGSDESKLPPPDRSADGIGVVDLAAGKLVRTLPSGQDPETFDLVDDATLAVSNEETAEAAIVDARVGRIRTRVGVGGEPEGVTTARDGTVWVTCEAAGTVDVIEPKAGRRVATIAVGHRPRNVLFANRLAFVSNESDGTVSVVDVARRAVGATIALPAGAKGPARPMGLARSRDGAAIYVTTGRGGGLAVLDAATGRLERTIDDVGPRPWGVAVAPDGRVYTANGASNDVAVIDPKAGHVVARIPVGASPWGVAIDR